MEQLLPDTTSLASHPLSAMFSPELSLEKDFSDVLRKLQDISVATSPHKRFMHQSWVVMTSGSKLGVSS